MLHDETWDQLQVAFQRRRVELENQLIALDFLWGELQVQFIKESTSTERR